MTDFDKYVERRDTGSVKWDRYRGTDIIPMWVADMDFPSPPSILEALRERVAHGVFGYGNAPQDLLNTVIAYTESEYGWAIRPDWVVWLPGLVTGLNIACRAVGSADDEVLTMTPVYPPFLSAPELSHRRLLAVPLMGPDRGRYEIDWEGLERAVTPRTRLMLLCNPHNPVGRVYGRFELQRLEEFCLRHNLIVCADEIHAGLVLEEGMRHIPFASLSPEGSSRSITLFAPSKTFNIPGLGFSFAVIPDSTLRTRFRAEMKGIVPDINILGYVAGLAAYREGASWRKDLIDYLRGNREILRQGFSGIAGLRMAHIEGTYLAWIDARDLGVTHPQRFFEAGLVGLSDGADFGAEGFVRLNFGCRRALLKEAIARMAKAVAERKV